MDTPGFDPVSATGQVAGGANLIPLINQLARYA
jgi:altronate dehydratase